MTECERLVIQGTITKDFLEEEIICDYKVTTELKKIWALELDLLEQFAKICEKHKLLWFACAGTLLGAVRHGGFIPWDDDLDICMPREDYDLLTQKYVSEFEHPYFLQTPYTDSEYAFSFAKLRNVNTCFAARAFIESPMNQGVFLDIFPLDNSPMNGYIERREKIQKTLRLCSAYMSRNNIYIQNKHTEYAKTVNFSKGDNVTLYERIQEIASSVKSEPSLFCSAEVTTVYTAEKNHWPKDCFCKFERVPFCNTYINVPQKCERILEIQYGDYNVFPPKEQRGLWHKDTIINTDVAFSEVREQYIKELEKNINLK